MTSRTTGTGSRGEINIDRKCCAALAKRWDEMEYIAAA